MDDDFVTFDEKDALNDTKNKRRRKKKDDTSPVQSDSEDTNILRIKEFDLQSMPPNTLEDHGIKIVVIGKPGCFAPGTKVLMFDGTVKNVEDVVIGDILMGDDNTERNVLALYHDCDEMFEIVPEHGQSYTVNIGHDLVLVHDNEDSYLNGSTIEISVREYLTKDNSWKSNWKLIRSNPVNWMKKEVDDDVYNIGLNIFESVEIDKNILVNNLATRRKFLSGVLDSENSVYFETENCFKIKIKNKEIINDLLFLSRSLGLSASSNSNENFSYINLIGDFSEISFRYKEANINKSDRNWLIANFKVIPKGEGEYFGFSIDKNRRFLLASFDIVRNTGKSTLIKDIVATKSFMVPVAQIFSGTEDSNHFYTQHFPSVCVHNKLDMEAIKNFVVRQKLAMKYIENPWAIQIIDDCTDNPAQLRDPVFQAYYKNGRHWRMIHILSLQYCLDILPSIRTNIDYTFILRETNQKNRKALYENYAGNIETFAQFNELMDVLTEDYTALVINNRSKTNKLEDCVFWYKADPSKIPGNWKFGHPTFWEYNLERNNDNFSDPLFS